MDLNKLSYCLFFIILNVGCEQSSRQLLVNPLFGDHMVLQQSDNPPIWGTAKPYECIKVTANWGFSSSTNTSHDGKWTLNLNTPSYGGPYTITISTSKDQTKFVDVMIGEVWLTAGQSNMEWPMWAEINNQKQEINEANYKNIRFFNVPKELKQIKQEKSSWKTTSSNSVIDFNAVGYFFARDLYEELEVPVGIINSSWGGTRIEAWTSMNQLASISSTAKEAKEFLKFPGGREGIKKKILKENTIIQKQNEKLLNSKGVLFPQNIEEWKELNLFDNAFKEKNFDDRNWQSVQLIEKDDLLTYENLFSKESLSSDGVIWFRQTFDVLQPDLDYKIITTDGIDDYDFTFINGHHIGTGLACCFKRSYSIPKGILREKNNVIAIRVIDMGGVGGFKGDIYLESENSKTRFDKNLWKFKHTALTMNTYFQTHNISYTELKNDYSPIEKLTQTKLVNNPNSYGVLFENMIQPLIPFGIKGILWYQGESNVSNPMSYEELFTSMISDWRKKWNRELPFYFVQIAPYEYSDEEESYLLREAQRKSLYLNKTGMAITMDIGEEKDIHPKNKQDVGARLARLALVNTYKYIDRLPTGPLYKSKMIYPNHIELNFDNAGERLIQKNKLRGFEIASYDRKFFSAEATITKNKIIVKSSKVKDPQYVRYGWKNYFSATLFNGEGLPASSFSSD